MLSLWVLAVACKKTDVKKLVVDADKDGYAIKDGDCNDAEPAMHPGAPEVCDALDNDCDTAIDEGLTTRWWFDGDGDGYGNGDLPFTGCVPPEGYSPQGKDCDDARPDAHPDAQELCNRRDDDCDGDIDEDAFVPVDTGGAAQLFADADGDGYGDPDVSADSCDEGVIDGTDCDDADAEVHPDHPDVCDDRDNDCDNDVDEDPDLVWYEDHDQDGWGGILESAPSCSSPGPSFAIEGGDCDDTDELVHPTATEVCDGVDQDCDGDPDAGAPGAGTWWEDLDGDTWGNPSYPIQACTRPPGSAWLPGDCDDSDPDVNIDGTETCDGVDEDCDGVVDDGAVDAIDVYTDADGDGWGDGAPFLGCAGPGAVTTPGDCDDADAGVFPEAVYTDGDGDGFGDDATLRGECGAPSGVTIGGDCDDTRNTVFPGAVEVCDVRDNDCDTVVDEDVGTGTFWYADADGDGHGDPGTGQRFCGVPVGLVLEGTDCDDTDASRSPDAIEVCNHTDDDCDGLADWGLRVPIDQPTIGAALLAASNGDTLCISPGVYYERLDPDGKSVVLEGTDGSGVTIVDGQRGGSVLTVDQGEVLTLRGLTFRRGFADAGAGIRATSSTLELEDVRVTDNLCDSINCRGTGIQLDLSTLRSPSGLTVDANAQTGTAQDCRGAGIAANASTLELTGAAILQNTQECSSVMYGAGVYATDATATLNQVAIADQTARSSSSVYVHVVGIGMFLAPGSVTWSEVQVLRNDYEDLLTPSQLFLQGAGLYFQSVAGTVDDLELRASTVDTTSGNATVYGGGGLFEYSQVEWTRVQSSDHVAAGVHVARGLGLRVANDFGSSFTDLGVHRNEQSCPGCTGEWVGALSVEGGYLTGTRIDVRGNVTDSGVVVGGGVYADRFQTDHLVVAGNEAGRLGGVVSGVGLYAAGPGRIGQADIVGNLCPGTFCYGAMNLPDRCDLTNVNVVGNEADAFTIGTPGSIRYTNDFGNVTLWGGVGVDGNVSADPAYTSIATGSDPTTWDLHLAPGSGATDAGDPLVLDADGSRSDIGAYGGPGGTW